MPASAEIFLRQREMRIFGEAEIVDPVDPSVSTQEFCDAPRILNVTLDAQRQSLQPLQDEETIEGRESCAAVALMHSAAARDIRRSAELARIDHVVIRRLRLGQHRIFPGMPIPREIAGIDDAAAQTVAVAAD